MVKNLPANAGDIRDAREEGTATHSNILTWRIPRTGEPGGLHVSQVYNEVFVYFSIQYYYPVFLPETYMIFII